MPILEVKALPQKDESLIPEALKKTTQNIAEVYGCKPTQVWATWQTLKADHYVEGHVGAHVQPENTHPPIAILTCFEGKDPETIEKLLEVASKTLTEELNLGDNMFMTYREAKSGQVIAGNGVIRK